MAKNKKGNRSIPTSSIKPIRVTDKVGRVGINIGGKEFFSDDGNRPGYKSYDSDGREIGQWGVSIPRQYLYGFKLSEIPQEVVIVGGFNLDDYMILGCFYGDLMSAQIVCFGKCTCCEKYDPQILEALSKAVDERAEKMGDVGSLGITPDNENSCLMYNIDTEASLPVEDAMRRIEGVLVELSKRCEQLLSESWAK